MRLAEVAGEENSKRSLSLAQGRHLPRFSDIPLVDEEGRRELCAGASRPGLPLPGLRPPATVERGAREPEGLARRAHAHVPGQAFGRAQERFPSPRLNPSSPATFPWDLDHDARLAEFLAQTRVLPLELPIFVEALLVSVTFHRWPSNARTSCHFASRRERPPRRRSGRRSHCADSGWSPRPMPALGMTAIRGIARSMSVYRGRPT